MRVLFSPEKDHFFDEGSLTAIYVLYILYTRCINKKVYVTSYR